MKKRDAAALRAAKWLLAALTLLLAALLIWQCADIYLIGISAENLSDTGVRISDIYSPELVAERFSKIAWAVVLWLAALAAVLVCRRVWPEAAPAAPRMPMRPAQPRERRWTRPVRLALYLAALAMLIAGIANGGMRDVFVKAVNICTECVGLG